MATLPSKREYIEARLTIERVHAERDWFALSKPKPATAPAEDDPNREITHKEAAKFLGISDSYLRRLEGRQLIHRVKKPGRTVYYKLKDVETLKRRLDR